MQTTLRIDDTIYREAKAEAAREGMTLTRFIEEALSQRLRQPAKRTQTGGSKDARLARGGFAEELDPKFNAEIKERNRLMEALLKRTAHFRVGRKLTREEMHAR
jgi:hypothetical protein